MIHAKLVEGADQEARDKFERDLNAPPRGWAAVERGLFGLLGSDE